MTDLTLGFTGRGWATASPLYRALRVEARSALSTPVARLLLVGSVVMALVACTANVMTVGDLASERSLRLVMHSATVAALVFSTVAGVYATSTDLRFGVIDQRLLTDPSRRRWFLSKAIIAAGVGLTYGVLGAATAVVAAWSNYAAKGVDFSPASAMVVRALVGLLVGAPLYAVLGAAVGAIVRNQPLAIGGALVWLLVLEPPLVLGAPAVGRWLPGQAGLALTNSPDTHLLGQVSGVLVLAAYALVASLFAVHRLRRTDVT
jgi:ABC-2 type transport system permease protein